jgi:hypothetical protein
MTQLPFPWFFTYVEDPVSGKYHPQGRTVYRPVVPITLAGADEDLAVTFFALVDSGCERCVASRGVARQIGVEPDTSRQIVIKIGGDQRMASPADVTLRLAPEQGAKPIEWRAEVDFLAEWRGPWQVVLGQIGFFDQFTVTFCRSAMQLAVEPMEEFDRRWDNRFMTPGD